MGTSDQEMEIGDDEGRDQEYSGRTEGRGDDAKRWIDASLAELADRSETRDDNSRAAHPAAHSGCPGDPMIVLLPSGARLELTENSDPNRGELWTTFPDDPARSRFVIGMTAGEHSADDILAAWWHRAPICG
ncbi:hypothetical protein NDR87_00020 [Nocardia sp. CDC159]|uniref:Uncharacterized protein n=1 Tax=Nocardia pulmonis TaxID=2951408 RepID=A0A9X2E4C9_9NOCA|nr:MULTISPECIES: hypothetical protein [Nocardia]MCM6772605.1 hypothetical protein [Nocardia pulmonis]MCM6784737.1 hypothetical protein [Nocardia sp. CDC159]